MRCWSVLLACALLPVTVDAQMTRLQTFEPGRPLPHAPVYQLGFIDEGKTLQSLSQSHGVARWNVQTGKLLWSRDLESSAHAGFFLSDGSLCLVGASLFDIEQNQPRGLATVDSGFNVATLSPNRRWVATGSDEHVVIGEVKDAKLLHRCRGHDAYLTAVAFDPTSKLLASGAHDRTIRLWDVATGKTLRVLTGHTDQVSALMYLPDGKRLVSASWDRTARLWDAETGKQLRVFEGHRLSLKTLHVSADGKRLATSGLDGLACVWDIASGKRLQSIEASRVGVNAIALSHDGRQLATGALDSAIGVWDVRTGKKQWLTDGESESRTTRNRAECVAISRDLHAIASGAYDGGVRLFEVGKATPRLLGRQDGPVWSIAFSPDDKSIASVGFRDGTVHIWDRANGGEVKRLTGAKGGTSRVVYSKDGKILVAGGGSLDPTIFVWDVEQGKALHRLAGHRNFVQALALSEDAKWLASSCVANSVRLWNLTTGKEAHPLEQADRIVSLSFHPRSDVLAGGDENGTIYLWDVATGKVRSRLGDNPGQVYVGFLRDGRTLVSAGGRIDLYEMAGERKRLQRALPEEEVRAFAIDPTGRRIVSAHADLHAVLVDPVGWDGKPLRLDEQELEERWRQLADNPFKAHEAIWCLTAASTQAVPLFEKNLQLTAAATREQLDRWVEDLGSRRFRVREQAARELAKQGDVAVAALRRGLKRADELETRRRLEALLEAASNLTEAPELLRRVRMVETLEKIGTPEARRLLEKMAIGTPEMRQTREASESLQRLRTRP